MVSSCVPIELACLVSEEPIAGWSRGPEKFQKPWEGCACICCHMPVVDPEALQVGCNLHATFILLIRNMHGSPQ